MGNASNERYTDFTSVVFSPISYNNLLGPSFQLTLSAIGYIGTRPNRFYSTGKRYLEFNLRWTAVHDCRYRVGVVTPQHPVSTKLGNTDQSWGFETASVKFVHDSTLDSPITEDYEEFADCTSYKMGWFYISPSTDYEGYILRMAVDFDAGKIWFGVICVGGPAFNTVPVDVWTGDPAAGTGATYTFTPNTPLAPAIYLIDDHDYTAWQNFQGCISAVSCYCRGNPPSGFSYWDHDFYEQEAVLADSPLGYWLAHPMFLTTRGEIAYPAYYLDFSSNKRHLPNVYFLTTSLIQETRAVLGRWREVYKNTGPNVRPVLYYPCPLSSSDDFTFEAVIEITGAGRVGGGSNTWKEGSYLFCNGLNPTVAAINDADVWIGVSLRDRKLKFGVGSYEATTGDIANGSYHLIAELDYSAGALRIYLNAVQVAETTGYSDPSKTGAWFSVGGCDPAQTNGAWPGYYREIAAFDAILSSDRKSAHYQRAQHGPRPAPISVRKDPIGSLIPNFMR